MISELLPWGKKLTAYARRHPERKTMQSGKSPPSRRIPEPGAGGKLVPN